MSKSTNSAPALSARRATPVVPNSITMVPKDRPPSCRRRFTGFSLTRPSGGGRRPPAFARNGLRLQHLAVDHVAGRPPLRDGEDAGEGALAHHAEALVRPGQGVGRQDHVVELEDRVRGIDGFLLEDVEGGAGDGALPQGRRQRRLIDDGPAGDVDQVGRRLHPVQLRGADEVAGLRGQGTADEDEVGLPEQVRQRHQPRPSPAAASLAGEGIGGQQVHLEGRAQPADPRGRCCPAPPRRGCAPAGRGPCGRPCRPSAPPA